MLEEETYRVFSRFAASQWEMTLLCNNVSHWIGRKPRISPDIFPAQSILWGVFIFPVTHIQDLQNYLPLNRKNCFHIFQAVKKYPGQIVTRFSPVIDFCWPALTSNWAILSSWSILTVYPKKYAHGFCFAVLCCGYTLTDFPISIRLTSLALWQSNDCPSASKATLMNMDKYFMWIHYERLHNHNKAKHNKTVCIFLGIYCM